MNQVLGPIALCPYRTGVASEWTRAHFGFCDRRARRIGVSRRRGLPEDSPGFPGKEILDELIGDLPVE
ncbi:MAG: hypothetical protein HRJ53_20480 [Acidobacteria bacterium Pan2503]|uniref:Uncharacterized protein n=1 Tax=Candidatus Acidiferrum panamense TaxID=2741543 RepID=A0A7V8NTX3_9BACT|nr:hypothetical protein [Candidatus Acidoferrum panamensis]